MNTSVLLDHWARETPDASAMIDVQGGPLSFAELRDAVERGASLLRRHGVGRGDRVVVLVPISVPMYLVLLAVLRVGAVATVFDPSAGLGHIRRCCEGAKPNVFIGSGKAHALRLFSRAIREIPLKFHTEGGWAPLSVSWADAGSGAGSTEPSGVEALPADAPALMTFTSGSTGEPKAAVRSHGLLAAQGRAVAAAMGLGPGEIALTTLPVFTLANLAAGATTLLANANLAKVGAVNPAPVLGQIQRHRPQSVVASPAFLERLLEAPAGPRATLHHLRRIYTGGAPVYPDLMRRLAEAAPMAEVVAVYGSTEAEPVAHVALSEVSSADEQKMRTGGGLLAGRAVPEISLRILQNTFGTPIRPLTSGQFKTMLLAAGQAGEIVVSGEHVLKGYLDGVGDEGTKFRVGESIWHRTGDAGLLDESGRLWLLGRAEAVVRDERGELFPFAVEVAAREVPGVRRAALIVHEGRRLLAVEAEDEAVVSDVEQRLAEHVRWAKLDRVLRVPRIPLDKRHNAKVDYPALRKLVFRLV